MIDEAAALFEAFDGGESLAARHALFVGLTAEGSAIVQMAESRFVADPATGYVPQPNERVLILSVGERHLMFPVRAMPGTGTVLTVGGDRVTVQTTVGTMTLPYVGAAPTSGDLVGLSWSETVFVIGKLSSTPPPPAPPPDPNVKQTRSATFMAIDTGSHNVGSSNYWQAQPWASDSTFGGWFYGTQIGDTIPAAAEFVSLEFFVSWQQRQGGNPNFGLHSLPGKSGQLSFTNLAAWNPNAGWQTPPDPLGWFNALKAGGTRRGVGLSHGGYNKFSSRAQDGMTGALRISWKA